jgi:cysteinyl-tRNA synthetase
MTTRIHRNRAPWIFLSVSFITACVSGSWENGSLRCTDLAEPADNAPSATTPAGSSWLCQLQNADPQALAATDFDIVVIDYSRDGGEAGRYSRAEIAALKGGATAPRQVLAYLSIGEAEDYRYYFDPVWISAGTGQPGASAPCWLAGTNPQWAGNYKVQYWSENWQRIILEYLDRIMADGFDGVYLDIVDAFEYWSNPNNGEDFVLPEREAAKRMINWVKRIAHHARNVRGRSDFLVIPQNGERLLDYDGGIDYLDADDFLNTISGLGVEDLYYDETTPVEESITAARKLLLDRVRKTGKKILVVDYVDQGSRPPLPPAAEFRERAIRDGYLPYAALEDRRLDEINSFAGQS